MIKKKKKNKKNKDTSKKSKIDDLMDESLNLSDNISGDGSNAPYGLSPRTNREVDYGAPPTKAKILKADEEEKVAEGIVV